MASTKSVCIPLTMSIHLFELNTTHLEFEKEYMSHVAYASVVGSLMYAMVCTKPDLTQAISVVSRYMGNHRKEHWQVVKCILRYLKGTTNIGLVYHRSMSYALAGYSYSNYATDLDARRYVTGYAFMIDNSLVSWKTTLQRIVALSSTEVEYMTLVEVVKKYG